MYDGSDRRQVKKAEKDAKQAQAADDVVVTSIMSTTSGRGWMFRLLAQCELYTDGFSDLPVRTAHITGKRNIGLRIQEGVLRACPDQYIAMLREANVRDHADDARQRRDHEERGRVDSDAEGGDSGDEAGTGFIDETYDDRGPQ